jgi:hypothetical protein
VPDALVRFTYEHFENCYASPRWWELLSDEQRRCLLRRMALAASDQVIRKAGSSYPQGGIKLSARRDQVIRKADCLMDDGLQIATRKVLKRERV